MIISASRRTDIPAFFSPWLVNRLRAGSVLVRNPFNRRQVSRIRLTPSVVDCVVLWTKNPAPLLPYLEEIADLGYPVVMHFTITACDQTLEPGLPGLHERIATFRTVSEKLGPERVWWRFDPILLTRIHDSAHWLDRFAVLAHALQGHTRQCTVSFVSLYAKCRRNLAGIDLLEPGEKEKRELALGLAACARAHGIRPVACCDPFLTNECGVEQAHCIDSAQLGAILGSTFRPQKDPGQRPGCGCSLSIDIGAYDSCAHGCRYCYANTSARAVARNRAAHDPQSPLLIGHLQGDETIHEREMVSLRVPQSSLFGWLPQERQGEAELDVVQPSPRPAIIHPFATVFVQNHRISAG
jgi:hypothetical protein